MNKFPKKSDPAIKRGWYTYAVLTAEGKPYPSHNLEMAFRYLRAREEIILSDLKAISRGPNMPGGGAISVWKGILDHEEALNGPSKPIYYIHEGGRIEPL
jgi:hypothetical protein